MDVFTNQICKTKSLVYMLAGAGWQWAAGAFFGKGWPGCRLPRWLSGKESACQHRRCRRPGFNPWDGKIPWGRERLPTPVFLPGESHGQRSLASCSPWGRKESDMTEQLSMHTWPGCSLLKWKYSSLDCGCLLHLKNLAACLLPYFQVTLIHLENTVCWAV